VQLTDNDLRQINDAASQIHAEGDRYAPVYMEMACREAPAKEDA
jgi:hypothetical protein